MSDGFSATVLRKLNNPKPILTLRLTDSLQGIRHLSFRRDGVIKRNNGCEGLIMKVTTYFHTIL